jgi:Spy/CpxP family protein refolding chaperone
MAAPWAGVAAAGHDAASEPLPVVGAGQAGGSPPQTAPGGQRPTGQRSGGPKPWWQDEQIRGELGLTPEQVQNLQTIWEKDRSFRIENFQELDRQERELDRLMAARADVETVTRQLDLVELHRSIASKHRVLLLYRISLELTPEQDQRLRMVLERERGRRGSGSQQPR